RKVLPSAEAPMSAWTTGGGRTGGVAAVRMVTVVTLFCFVKSAPAQVSGQYGYCSGPVIQSCSSMTDPPPGCRDIETWYFCQCATGECTTGACYAGTPAFFNCYGPPYPCSPGDGCTPDDDPCGSGTCTYSDGSTSPNGSNA